MSSDRLRRLEEKLRDTGCPHCHHTLAGFIMRCDLQPGGECLALAHCDRCGFTVDLDQAPSIYEEFMEAMRRVRSAGCPTCQSPEVRVEYRCDLASRDCFYEATCVPAGHRYRF